MADLSGVMRRMSTTKSSVERSGVTMMADRIVCVVDVAALPLSAIERVRHVSTNIADVPRSRCLLGIGELLRHGWGDSNGFRSSISLIRLGKCVYWCIVQLVLVRRVIIPSLRVRDGWQVST